MKKNIIIRYALYFLIFAFYFYLEDTLGIRPFAIAFFMALVYCRQNILILSPLYIAAAVLVSPTLIALIYAAVPCLLIAAAFFIHYKIRVKVRLVMIGIYTFLSQIPLIVAETGDLYGAVNTVVSVLGAQLFLYAAVTVLYAILGKGLKFRLTTQEIICASAVFASFGMGFYAVELYGCTPFYTFLAVAVLAALFIDGKSAVIVAASIGLGGSVTAGNPSPLALSVLYGLVAACFTHDAQYFAGLAVIAADAIFRAFFNLGEIFSYYSLIPPALGVGIFFAVPNKYKKALGVFAVCLKEKQASRMLVNRDRQLVADRLNNLSRVFCEIEDILHIENAARNQEKDIAAISVEVCEKCCRGCVSYSSCKEALGGGDPAEVVSGLVNAALDNGRASILDTPPFLSSRCRKINGVINAVNDAVSRYKVSGERRAGIEEGRAMVSSQMGGVAVILNELKKDVEKTLSYDAATEQKIIENLAATNIAATEAAVFCDSAKNRSLTLVMRESDISNTALQDTVSEVMGVRMEIVKTEKAIQGMCAVHFERAPLYKVVYGERDITKEGSPATGDRHGAVKISQNKIMLILSDGMGSGKSAGLSGSYAMSLIESFYRAGFDYTTVINSVSRLLSLREGEDFSAVDIAVVDTAEGTADFIKLGGRESFIVNKGAVEVIECGSLPLGIIDEPVPVIEKRTLSSGTFIVMVSDGVIDVLGREAMTALLSESRTLNPDTLAANIMAELLRMKPEAQDDASILVARIIAE